MNTLDTLPLIDALENILWKLNHKDDKGEWMKIDNHDATVRYARKLLEERAEMRSSLNLT